MTPLAEAIADFVSKLFIFCLQVAAIIAGCRILLARRRAKKLDGER